MRSRKEAPQRRFLLIAVALSVVVHVVAALLVVLLPRVLPQEARRQEQGTVELLMVERKGAEPSQAGKPQERPPAPPQPEKPAELPKPEPPKPKSPAAASEPVPPPPVAEAAEESAPPPEVAPPQQAKVVEKPDTPPQPSPLKAPEAPVFDLAGTESESNAEALGSNIVPASPDNRFRNRPPIYPYEAAIHGEHGSVLLLIHVSEAGIAIGVDIVESSGVASLDQAASVAVRKWHFRPALQEGRAVPFDMPFRFVFQAD